MKKSTNHGMTTRRSFVRNVALIATAATAAPALTNALDDRVKSSPAPSSFAGLLEQPSLVTVFLEDEKVIPLNRSAETWRGSGCTVVAERSPRGLSLKLTAPSPSVLRVHLRWRAPLPAAKLRVLGDAWERSYGELEWREVIPERPLPWYFLTFDGQKTHGYGVAVGAAALAFWQCDREGISLWLDVRNGGKGVMLGERTLTMATVVVREGAEGESLMAAARALCHLMCPSPKKSAGPIYGSNDWYYAYGENSAEGTLRDADLVAELAPAAGPRPFAIADEGWENKQRFPDMARFAAAIRSKGVRPGIWIRPTQPAASHDARLLLPASRFASATEAAENLCYDPTIPEALDVALEKVRQVKAWQFELIKHDFSTYDLLGQWGFSMDASPALPGWSFNDRSRTSAEIIRSYYEAIGQIAGDSLVLGCNTIGHLGAGLFDAQRIGDDVSGRVWERTRRMGINTLAFRLPQHRAFFSADPDCIPITAKIPWELTRQWLDVVARSGAVLIISAEADVTGADVKSAIKSAFAVAASGGQDLAPVNWLETRTPDHWQAAAVSQAPGVHYDWLEPEGAFPFKVWFPSACAKSLLAVSYQSESAPAPATRPTAHPAKWSASAARASDR